MKNLMTFFVFVWGPVSSLPAQDWVPFADSGYVYYYQLDGHYDLIPLQADSVKRDTTFFDRVVLPCDTCQADSNQYCYHLQGPYEWVHMEQAPLLLQGLIDQGSGLLTGYGKTALSFEILATTGTSWMLDSTSGTQATVLAETEQLVFDQLDSVKVWILSSGDTIRLSKHNGFLQFPRWIGANTYYRLIGIEGKEVGRTMPRLWDFYDFEPGDKFEYKSYSRPTSSITMEGWDQFTVLNRIELGDSILYEVEGYQKIVSNDGSVQYFTYQNLNYLFQENHSLNNSYGLAQLQDYHPIRQSPLTESFYYASTPCAVADRGYVIDSLNLLTLSRGVSVRPYFLRAEPGTGTILEKPVLGKSQALRSESMAFDAFWGMGGVGIRHVEGMGLTQYHNWTDGREFGTEKLLVAYRKKGVQAGTFTPTLELIAPNLSTLPPPALYPDFEVFPNPAEDSLRIHLPEIAAGDAWLFTLTGKQVIHQSFAVDREIRMDLFPPLMNGLYLLLVKTDSQSYQKKIWILR